MRFGCSTTLAAPETAMHVPRSRLAMFCLVPTILFLTTGESRGWSAEGHMIVALVADRLLQAQDAAAHFEVSERQRLCLLGLIQVRVNVAHDQCQSGRLGVFLAQHAAGSFERVNGERLSFSRLPIEIVANRQPGTQSQGSQVVRAKNFAVQR